MGNYYNAVAYQTLFEHWNGVSWQVKPSVDYGRDSRYNNRLRAVAATSSRNAWAVGSYTRNAPLSPDHALIEHWDGRVWKVQAARPLGSLFSQLYAVAATSSRNAWAVGFYFDRNRGGVKALIEHWDGKAWKMQPSPSSSRVELWSVTATSSRNAWAVGAFHDNAGTRTLIEHWDGKSWKSQPSPSPGVVHREGNDELKTNQLDAVAATSLVNAWAVGYYADRNGHLRTLVVHWNGHAWKRQPSPSPGTGPGVGSGDQLGAVAAASSTNAWAVGTSPTRILVERWNGRAWQTEPTPNASHSLGFQCGGPRREVRRQRRWRGFGYS